jgi:hypothetical protein
VLSAPPRNAGRLPHLCEFNVLAVAMVRSTVADAQRAANAAAER